MIQTFIPKFSIEILLEMSTIQNKLPQPSSHPPSPANPEIYSECKELFSSHLTLLLEIVFL